MKNLTKFRVICMVCVLVFSWLTASNSAIGQDQKLVNALNFKPKQKQVDFDIPQEADVKDCKLETIKIGRSAGFIVRDAANRPLRLYLDTNSDKKLDQWSYFKDGLEVYRDIDSDHDGRADEFRWIGTAGTRWGIDTNNDNEIDKWKTISAEEVSAEVVAALKDRDADRFKRLLVTPSELKGLELDEDLNEDLKDKIIKAGREFEKFANGQKIIDRDTVWIHFGGMRPGVVPAGTPGIGKDLTVYDNVASVVETNGETQQIALGTLIRIGENWRLIELPQVVDSGDPLTIGGVFYRDLYGFEDGGVGGAANPKLQALFGDFEKMLADLESARTKGDKRKLERLNVKLASILDQIIEVENRVTERASWIRQYSDMISGAYQNGEFEDGLVQLRSLVKNIEFIGRDDDDREPVAEADIAHVVYRIIMSKSSRELNAASNEDDIAKVQDTLLGNLEMFIKKYPRSEYAAEALYNVGSAAEYSKPDDAEKLYRRILNDYPTSDFAKKAKGAYRRLTSEGKKLDFAGRTMAGDQFELDSMKGKIVVLHYWDTSLGTHEVEELNRLEKKYGRKGLEIVGACLDNDVNKANKFLKTNKMPWTQLYDGGADGPLADSLGISLVPTTMLIDKDGKVVKRRISVSQLDKQLKGMF